jgi:hypothetical protein
VELDQIALAGDVAHDGCDCGVRAGDLGDEDRHLRSGVSDDACQAEREAIRRALNGDTYDRFAARASVAYVAIVCLRARRRVPRGRHAGEGVFALEIIHLLSITDLVWLRWCTSAASPSQPVAYARA